jgi:hypothetical protein
MATFDLQTDSASAVGALVVRSATPAVLAAVPDALAQSLGWENDVVSAWALHPSEQDTMVRDNTYQNERAELGVNAAVDVVELVRPRQQNVIWVDRFHLVAQFRPPSLLTRLLGLYAGGEGELIAWVHDYTVGSVFAQTVRQIPQDRSNRVAGVMPEHGAGWDSHTNVEQSRCGIRYDGRQPDMVRVTLATPFRQQGVQALQQLAAIVSPW